MLAETMVDVEPILSIAANVYQIVGGLIVAAIGIWRLTRRLKKWVHNVTENVANELKAEVKKATYPIQPDANGGNSLPDATKMLKSIAARQIEIGERTARIEGALATHLSWHNGGLNGD